MAKGARSYQAAKTTVSKPADLLAFHLKAAKIPFVRELRFCPERRWRLDFLIADKIACEVDGGVWTGGRHTRGRGFTSDCEKLNQATLMGYQVLRFTSNHVHSGYALQTIEAALNATASSARR